MNKLRKVTESTELQAGPAVEKTGDNMHPAKTEETATAGMFPASARDRLVRLAYRFLWNQHDAEDVAQEALTRACERASDLRDRDKWWSWVSRIVVHRCHELGRRKLRRERHQPMLRAQAAREAQGSGVDQSADEKVGLRQLLHELPRRQREVIVLRHLQGMAYGEIATVLGISAATARVHAQAGRETLRRLALHRYPAWFKQGTPGDESKR